MRSDHKRSGRISFAERHEDFWPFTRAGAITVLPQAAVDFSTLLIGALSGIATAGLYRLATKVGEAARIYTNPIAFVLYSEQCQAVEQGRAAASVEADGSLVPSRRHRDRDRSGLIHGGRRLPRRDGIWKRLRRPPCRR